jgi:hypothetical protein
VKTIRSGVFAREETLTTAFGILAVCDSTWREWFKLKAE